MELQSFWFYSTRVVEQGVLQNGAILVPRDAQGSWLSLVLSPVPGKWSPGQGREHFMKKQVLKGSRGSP